MANKGAQLKDAVELSWVHTNMKRRLGEGD